MGPVARGLNLCRLAFSTAYPRVSHSRLSPICRPFRSTFCPSFAPTIRAMTIPKHPAMSTSTPPTSASASDLSVPSVPDMSVTLPQWLPHRSDPSIPVVGPGTDWVSPVLPFLQDARDFRPPSAQFTHPPRVLILYGTLRPAGFSKCLAFECARILEGLGMDVRVFDPSGLPVRDPSLQEHPKVVELRALVHWSEAHIWSAAELHGNLCSVFKNQIDWIPLNTGSVRPTQGKCCAVLQVNGGSQSFNAVNTLRLLARWMRMGCVVNQSSVPMAWKQFDDDGRMKDGSLRDRVVDVMEEFVRTARVNREYSDVFTDRYSERKEKMEKGRLLTQAEKEAAKDAARKKAKANE